MRRPAIAKLRKNIPIDGGGEWRKRFYIFTNGETEKIYFELFKSEVEGIYIDVTSSGHNTKSLLELVRDYYLPKLKIDEELDQVWCVFDRDEFAADQVAGAFHIAKAHGIRIAYSDRCFEHWLSLHFEYVDSHRNQEFCIKLLEKYSDNQVEYNKTDVAILKGIFDQQEVALRNAKRLFSSYGLKLNDDMIAKLIWNIQPVTTVHFLVEELNKYRICSKK